MLYVPSAGSDFGWKLTNQGSTRPSGSAMGTTTTPGNNAKGSWVQCFSAIANDVYGIFIDINASGASGQSRDAIMDIGIDEAGGSSYTVKVPDLLCSMTITPNKGGTFYFFPLKIKAGSTIAARSSVNNATVTTISVFITLYGLPRNPEAVRTCSYIIAFGITAASSSGTAITPGTTSEGSWTSMGTTDVSYWYWQQGFGFANATTTDRNYALDMGLGDGTNMDVVITDQIWGCDTANRMNNYAVFGCERICKTSVGIYVRAQCSGTLSTGYSAAVYAGGG